MAEYELPYQPAAGYVRKPLQNILVNTGGDKKPVWTETATYPPFPWQFSAADDHIDEDAGKYWKLARSVGAVPVPLPAHKKEE